MNGALSEQGDLGKEEGTPGKSKYVMRACSRRTVDQAGWSGICRGQMGKGRLERQGGVLRAEALTLGRGAQASEHRGEEREFRVTS